MIFCSPLANGSWSATQAVPGRMTLDSASAALDNVQATRIRILPGDAPLGDPCAPRAEVCGIADAAGKPVLWGPDSGHVVIATAIRLGTDSAKHPWTVPSYSGPEGYFSVAPIQIHGGSSVSHPLAAVRCGVLDANSPVSLGLAVCVGPQPNAGINLAGRYSVPSWVWVRVLLDVYFSLTKGSVDLWCALGPCSTSWSHVASYSGPVFQSTNGVVDHAAYLKAGHYMGADLQANVKPPSADMWVAPVAVGNSWGDVLNNS